MSNFTCEHCSTDIIDSPEGFVTECEHYPKEPVRDAAPCLPPFRTDELMQMVMRGEIAA